MLRGRLLRWVVLLLSWLLLLLEQTCDTTLQDTFLLCDAAVVLQSFHNVFQTAEYVATADILGVKKFQDVVHCHPYLAQHGGNGVCRFLLLLFELFKLLHLGLHFG